MTHHSPAHTDPLTQLREVIAALDAVLPIQAPLQDFVHFNPLMHYEHLPFAQALRAAHADSGSLGYLPASEYRRFFRAGRITRHDLFAVLAAEPEQWVERELYVTALSNDIKAISFQQMRWQVEESHLLHQLLDDVGTRITLRGLVRKLADVDVLEQMLPLLDRHFASWLDQGIAALKPHAPGFYAYWREATLHDITLSLHGLDNWADHIESLHPDPLETIHQELMRLGIDKTHWAGYLRALALELPGWSGMFNWRAKHPQYYGLTAPVSLEDYLAVRLVLEHLYCRHFTSEHWQINASLPNIRGYFHQHQDEFFVRYHAYNSNLPEYLQHIAQQFLNTEEDVQPHEWHQLAHQILTWKLAPETILPMGTDIYRKAWRLFHLVQHMALDAKAVAQLERTRIEHMLAILETLDDPHTSGYLWLRAYEHHYQEEVFSAILNKESARALSAPPAAQLIFCMDDREESLRRHLEEIAPDMETFGAAGVFGLPNNWRALDAPRPLKLAQPVVTAVHELRETPTTTARQRLPAHLRRLRVLNWLKYWKNHRMRHSVVGTALSLPLLAAFAVLEMVGRSIMPVTYQRLLSNGRMLPILPALRRMCRPCLGYIAGCTPPVSA